MNKPEVSLKIPEYCEHFKDLIVEEISNCHHPAALHYGKTSVLGFLEIKQGNFYLQSLTISHLNQAYQQPDCSSEVRLFWDSLVQLPAHSLIHNTVQVYGEVMVFHEDEPISSINITSPKELVIHLKDKQIRADIELGLNPNSINNVLLEEIAYIACKYQPVIRVFHITKSSAARELISQNLQLRIARKNHQNKQNVQK